MGANFAKLQKLLGDRSGRDVFLISVSVDPSTDTPELLAMAAPRPFLLLGGNSADGDRGWPFIAAALPAYELYGKPARLGPEAAFEQDRLADRRGQSIEKLKQDFVGRRVGVGFAGHD